MSKTNLITSLKTAITALEADTINYNWEKQQSCNCGVVAQAVLKKTSSEILGSISSMVNSVTREKQSGTWKNCVKNFCNITGESTQQIFKDLSEAGLSAQDICHLEYLENPAILKKAKIRTGIFNKMYFQKKSNLIKYLKAWVQILEQESKPADTINTLNKNQLREELLKAESNQEFEKCAVLRDKIAVTN